MKKTYAAVACALAIVFSPGNANALTVVLDYGDDYYLGFVSPGTPANIDVTLINWLLALDPNGLDTTRPLNPSTNYIVSREDSPASLCAVGTCDPATGSHEDVTTNLSSLIDVSGYTYLLGKWGNVAHVWVVSGIDSVFLPNKLDLNGTQSQGLSNYGRYNKAPTAVPDGGATVGLLGLAMLGVGYLRRRMV
jgi:hypothetical protein